MNRPPVSRCRARSTGGTTFGATTENKGAAAIHCVALPMRPLTSNTAISEGYEWARPKIGTLPAPVTCNIRFMASRDVGKRVAEHRVRLREQGLRPLQIWVPDTRAPEFAEEAHRQSALAAATATASDDQAFVDATSVFNDEDFDA